MVRTLSQNFTQWKNGRGSFQGNTLAKNDECFKKNESTIVG